MWRFRGVVINIPFGHPVEEGQIESFHLQHRNTHIVSFEESETSPSPLNISLLTMRLTIIAFDSVYEHEVDPSMEVQDVQALIEAEVSHQRIPGPYSPPDKGGSGG